MNCFEIKVTQSYHHDNLSKPVLVIDAAKELRKKKHKEIHNNYIRGLGRREIGVTGDGTRCKTWKTAKTKLLRYITSKY